MLPGGLIGAIYKPGFQEDSTSWRLLIDDAGNVYQHLHFLNEVNPHPGLVRQEQRVIDQTAVLNLLVQAEQIGFAEFQEKSSVIADDAPILSLTIRFEAFDKTVWRYWLTPAREDQQTHNFLELWRAIHSHAPFSW